MILSSDTLPHTLTNLTFLIKKKKDFRCGDTLGDRKTFYENFMNGCREAYPGTSCDDYERDRIAMSLRQPQSMVNYTSTGFKKIKAPKELWNLLSNHWQLNKGTS